MSDELPASAPPDPAVPPAPEPPVEPPAAETPPDNGIGIPDDRLSELERQVVQQFVSPEEDSTPSPSETPPAETTPAQPASAESTPEPSPPPATATPATEGVDFAADGRPDDLAEWTPEDQAAARELVAWSDKLTPDAVAQIDALMTGNYALIPLEDVPKVTAFYQAQQNPAPPAPPAPSSPPPSDSWGEEEVTADPQLAELRARVDAQEAAFQFQQQTSQLEQTRAEINAGAQQFFASRPDLSAEDRSRLETWVVESGVYAQHASRLTPRQAVQQALTQGLAVDPVISQRRIDAQVASRLADEREALAAQTRQNAGSSALAGSGSVMAPNSKTVDPDASMVEMIRQALQQ